MSEKYEYAVDSAAAYKNLGIKSTSYEMAFLEAEGMLGDIRGKDFLDFGCGTGRSSRFLKGLGAKRVLGVDHNANMLVQAKSADEEGMEFTHIATQIPEPASSFDGALSCSAFVETKTMEAMKVALVEIARVLKPGGVFVLTTANPAAFGHDFKNYSRIGTTENLTSGQVTQCRVKGEIPFVIEDVYWTEQDYVTALESAGFSIEKISFPRAEAAGDWIDETKVAPEMVIKTWKSQSAPMKEPTPAC